MAESLSAKNIGVDEKIKLYELCLKYKNYVHYCPGLCQFFQDLWALRNLITQSRQDFLIKEIEDYRKSMGIIQKYVWEPYDPTPRIQYLENRLSYYKNIQDETDKNTP